ncbi:MAG: tRNA threonylcarbamoyladenosine dehydratase [Solobacterium sp.]|nr:tRNA threonylcarbamoyladenosine dehydratase [Solobacterium sp.]
MADRFSRARMVIGAKAYETLKNARIAVFGLGGVGGNCAEALVRCGVGTLDLIDSDVVVETNINRQVIATEKTVGMRKTDAAELRFREINPEIVIHKYPMFYLPETASEIPFESLDFIVDAIDTVSAKISIAERAKACGIPMISAMGCGNRLDPSQLKIMDLADTKNDPLARVMRRELRKRGIFHLPVCCSLEPPLKPIIDEDCEKNHQGRYVPGSTSFVPPSAGILAASYAVKILTRFDPEKR